MTAQPDTVQRTREEKFRWDEENRLTALSQNGYVSHYWYDADGDRTVKMHGGSMAVFVNSERDGRSLGSQQTTAYFSPYFSIKDNCFAKHLYIGSERVASMTGDLSPGDVSNSPAGGYNISHAGYDVGVTQLNIPYAYKRAAMIDSAEANYAYFDLPNALEGQSRQTSEYVLPAEDSEEMGNGGSVGSGTGPRGGNIYNGNIWFIHTDHLGSSTLVTDGNGDISQQIEYLPYGEVFLEKQSTTYATPYKFNGKELDEETGLYYYGARYMNPRLSIWYGCDPLQEKYPNISTYSYCAVNPVNAIDSDGKLIIFINGFHTGDGGQAKYWEGKDILFKNLFYDRHSRYYDGSLGGSKKIMSSGAKNANTRIQKGFDMGLLHGRDILKSLKKGEKIRLVTHSMGAAFAKGLIKGLQYYAKQNNISIEDLIQLEVDLAPYQPDEQSANENVRTIVISHKYDHIAGCKPMPGAENHVTRGDKSFWNLDSEHSINSFNKSEIEQYVPSGVPCEGGNNNIWEQKSSN